MRLDHSWIAYAAAGWSLIFAAFHLFWAAGWFVGLDPVQASEAFAKPAFLAYDLVVAGMCLIAVPLSLALGVPWGQRVSRPILGTVAWIGTALLGLRALASLGQAAYELTAGRFTFERMGIWEPWFYLGAVLFALNLWLYKRQTKGAEA